MRRRGVVWYRAVMWHEVYYISCHLLDVLCVCSRHSVILYNEEWETEKRKGIEPTKCHGRQGLCLDMDR